MRGVRGRSPTTSAITAVVLADPMSRPATSLSATIPRAVIGNTSLPPRNDLIAESEIDLCACTLRRTRSAVTGGTVAKRCAIDVAQREARAIRAVGTRGRPLASPNLADLSVEDGYVLPQAREQLEGPDIAVLDDRQVEILPRRIDRERRTGPIEHAKTGSRGAKATGVLLGDVDDDSARKRASNGDVPNPGHARTRPAQRAKIVPHRQQRIDTQPLDHTPGET